MSRALCVNHGTSRQSPDQEDMCRWREQAIGIIESSPGDDLGFLHGEAFPRAFHQTSGGGLDVETLEYAGVGDRLYDIATARFVMEVHLPSEAEEQFRRFMTAYTADRQLTFEPQTLRAWVAIRHLRSMYGAWIVAIEQGVAGRVQNVGGLKDRAAFARRWTLA